MTAERKKKNTIQILDVNSRSRKQTNPYQKITRKH